MLKWHDLHTDIKVSKILLNSLISKRVIKVIDLIQKAFMELDIYRQTFVVVVAVQLLSCVQLFATPWTAAHQASLSITNPGACSSSCPLN